ncbi:MAG: carboxylesterase/lipase family protein [Mycolicibacterium insubricum]|nr:carboxylesterase/lipase family protein [Mycobacterium sp.]
MHDRIIRATIDAGVVEGFTRDGVHRWRAIPYAAAPVGPLRLVAPQPVQPWRGVRHCHTHGNCAPQSRMYTVTGLGRYQPMGEDCLTLNVVAPENPGDQPLPVMVFVHGGAYMLGSSATPIYDGAGLARRGCVYVSVNYRLGALGALDLSVLSTPDNPIDDNLFIRDLVAALRWVQTNIAVFGGDPQRVTVFGESAGAHAVASLLAVPSAEGLFSQVISESPAAGMARSPQIAEVFAGKLVEVLGCRRSDAASALKQADTALLVRAVDRLIGQTTKEMAGAFPLGPTYGTEVMPVDPVEAMRSGTALRVPLIVGSNAEEARLFTRFLKLLPVTERRIESLLATQGIEGRDRIVAAYPEYPAQAACVQFGGDFAFGSAVWQFADAHSQHAPTYVYRYDYAPRTLKWTGVGATHATELLAVFDTYRSGFGKALTVAGDRKVARRISNDVQNRWREFARTGVPGGDWPRYDTVDRPVLVFDKRSRVELDPHAERRAVWADFSMGNLAQQ